MKVYSLEDALLYPEKITELFIYNRNLTEVPEEIFLLKKLKALVLRNNLINSVPDWLAELSNLETLDLAENKLTTFPISISNIPNLKQLNLENNKLKGISEKIGLLKKLQLFNASKNEIERLPNTLFVSSLRTLILAENEIQKLPKAIRSCVNLLELNLQNNKLGKLPNEIVDCVKLNKLNLNNNRIKALPQELVTLEVLSVSKNKIIELPSDIGKSPWLTFLDISENKIKELPASISDLKWLRSFKLNKNQIKELPKSLGNLQRLTFLNVEYNKLEKLPDSITKLSSLHSLFLKGNKLVLNKEILVRFEKLRTLSGNKMMFTNKERIEILSFLSHAHKKRLTETERVQFYNLMTTKKEYDIITLVRALKFPVKSIRENALFQILKTHNAALPLTKQSVITFTGKSNLNKKKAADQLTEIGYNCQLQIKANSTHIILGEYPNESALFKRMETKEPLTFLKDQEVQAYISNHPETNFNHFNPDESENIRQLLLSEQESSLQVAIQILQQSGFPKDIITDLFIAYKTCKSQKIKRQLKALIQLNGSEQLQKNLNMRLNLDTPLLKDLLLENIQRFAKGTELDIDKMENYFLKRSLN